MTTPSSQASALVRAFEAVTEWAAAALVAAGVARSRSDALGWCVRLVADHEGDWLDELRNAIATVDRVRSQGPA